MSSHCKDKSLRNYGVTCIELQTGIIELVFVSIPYWSLVANKRYKQRGHTVSSVPSLFFTILKCFKKSLRLIRPKSPDICVWWVTSFSYKNLFLWISLHTRRGQPVCGQRQSCTESLGENTAMEKSRNSAQGCCHLERTEGSHSGLPC